MGCTLVSGIKCSSVAIHQNYAICIYRNALIKYQIFTLNINMPKIKLGGAEGPIITNFYKIDN